ncbi:MAG: DUF86 domain-containing protein [Acidobacteria bacterium]|nr:DUF86 domain-containing protein [Acidobacteriota bacterium]
MLDMLEAARRAETFVEGMTEAAFLDDIKTQSAVLHQLTVLGEAVRRVSQSFRDAHPGIQWKEMAGLRSRIVHDYDEIDLDEVWNILKKDLPSLIPRIEAIARMEPE